jgi:secreted trypsin-like serine protease
MVSSLLACSLIGCLSDPAAGTDDNAPAADQQAIIGGTTDTGDPSVVAVFAHAPGSTTGTLCSGSVISSNIVLTAAHCVDPSEVGSGQVFEILSGSNINTATHLAVVNTAFDPAFDLNNLSGGHDVGLVELLTPTTLTPLPYDHSAPGTGPVRLVGYGSNTHTNSGAGTKRQATATIASISSTDILIGDSNTQNCHGDSGGPAFQTIFGSEVIVGVTSYGTDNSSSSVCFGGGVDTRTDVSSGFIDNNRFGIGTTWNAWSSVSQGHAGPGVSVTAAPTGDGRFALFLADPNGGVYTAS